MMMMKNICMCFVLIEAKTQKEVLDSKDREVRARVFYDSGQNPERGQSQSLVCRVQKWDNFIEIFNKYWDFETV